MDTPDTTVVACEDEASPVSLTFVANSPGVPGHRSAAATAAPPLIVGSGSGRGGGVVVGRIGDRRPVFPDGGFRLEPAAVVVPHIPADDLDHAGDRDGEQGAENAGELGGDQDRH